jgi:hypothetical protein
MSKDAEPQLYYSEEAYRADRIPVQADSAKRSPLHKLTGTRLPWGHTQDVVPENIMEDPKPESMRFWEQWEKEKAEMKANGKYVPRPFEDVELHCKYDHERFRFAQLPFRSQFWLSLRTFCKWGMIILLPLCFLIDSLFEMDSSEFNIRELTNNSITLLIIKILLPPWIISSIIVNYFPKVWFRPPKGPLWELNRVTGQVTIFNCARAKIQNKTADMVAPFHEFDAYIVTSPDRQGLPTNGLQLAHRYSNTTINLSALITPDNTTQRPCALWDFLQNFMDTQRPLPEIPMYEPYRNSDPTTFEHDKKNGRPARYWIDMDNDTFKEKVKEMLEKIDTIDTFARPNLMAKSVKYID